MESNRSYGIFCNEAMAGGNYVCRKVRCGQGYYGDHVPTEKKIARERDRKGKDETMSVEEDDKLRKSTRPGVNFCAWPGRAVSVPLKNTVFAIPPSLAGYR